MHRRRGRFEQLYLLYLERFRRLRTAVRRHDTDSLRVAELEFASLPAAERRVLAMAVHDIVADLPRRGKVHFLRDIARE